MVKNEKNILENILKKNGIWEVEEILIQDLIEVVREDTFGYKVATALNQRKQGQFDKAMLNISEANRDQVLSIRAIQSIIDKIKGSSKTERILKIKTSIVDCICGVIQANHSQISITDRISLVKNIYLILSSSIQILDAKFVEVEQNT